MRIADRIGVEERIRSGQSLFGPKEEDSGPADSSKLHVSRRCDRALEAEIGARRIVTGKRACSELGATGRSGMVHEARRPERGDQILQRSRWEIGAGAPGIRIEVMSLDERLI
jgi:hypothetical protein